MTPSAVAMGGGFTVLVVSPTKGPLREPTGAGNGAQHLSAGLYQPRRVQRFESTYVNSESPVLARSGGAGTSAIAPLSG
jgi:hypothetical protein